MAKKPKTPPVPTEGTCTYAMAEGIGPVPGLCGKTASKYVTFENVFEPIFYCGTHFKVAEPHFEGFGAQIHPLGG